MKNITYLLLFIIAGLLVYAGILSRKIQEMERAEVLAMTIHKPPQEGDCYIHREESGTVAYFWTGTAWEK
jgi:hypothetical protein